VGSAVTTHVAAAVAAHVATTEAAHVTATHVAAAHVTAPTVAASAVASATAVSKGRDRHCQHCRKRERRRAGSRIHDRLSSWSVAGGKCRGLWNAWLNAEMPGTERRALTINGFTIPVRTPSIVNGPHPYYARGSTTIDIS
jgi:hypothetical protein